MKAKENKSPMTRLETVAAVAKSVPCPICLNSKLEVNINGERPKSPSDFHAVCSHCHHKMVITQDTKTMEEAWLRLEQSINNQGCPECGDLKLNLEFLCDADSNDCFFLVKCGDNGHYSRINQEGVQFLFQ